MPLCLSLTGSTTLCISLYLCPALCWQRGKCPSKQRPRRAKDQAVTGPCRHTPKQAQAVENLIQWSMHRPRQATAQASRQAKAQAWSSVGIDADSLLVFVSVRLCLPAYFCFSVCVVSRCSSAFVCLSLTSLCLLRLHALTLFLPLSYCFTTVYAFTSVSAGTSVSVFTSVPFASDSAFTSVSVYLQASVFASLNETMNLLSSLLSVSVYQF